MVAVGKRGDGCSIAPQEIAKILRLTIINNPAKNQTDFMFIVFFAF